MFWGANVADDRAHCKMQYDVKRRRPKADTALFLVDGHGFIFSEATQEIYGCNDTATFVWLLLEEGRSQKEIISSLCGTLKTSQTQAREYFNSAVRTCDELGLLEGAGLLTETSASNQREDVRQVSEEWVVRPSKVHGEHVFRILDREFRLRFSTQGQEENILPLFKQLLVPEARNAACTVDLIERGGHQEIANDGVLVFQCRTLQEIVPGLKSVLLDTCLKNSEYFFAFHAAAVRYQGECILLPGGAGSGKTMLTAALIRCGFEYMADDFVFLDENSFRVRGLPFSLCIKEGGLSALAHYYPEIENLSLHFRADGKYVRYLQPPLESNTDNSSDSCRVKAVVFPRYVRDGQARIVQLGKAFALPRLLQQSARGTHLTEKKIQNLIHWLDSIPCFELELNSLSEGVKAIRGISD